MGLAMINMDTKFEVSTKIIKVKQNVEIGVVWGGYGSPKVTSNVTIL